MFGGVPVTRPVTEATILASGPSSRGGAGAIRGSPSRSGASNACSLAASALGTRRLLMPGSCPVERGYDRDPRTRGNEQRRTPRF